MPSQAQIFTIGHSNQTLDDFIALLEQHGIEVLVDVRSQPYSKYAAHFDKEQLKAALPERGIKYLFLGKELGGRPDDPKSYDADGYALYWRMARSPAFLAGLERLEKGIAQYRVALMCGEENPTACHRRLLIGRVLAERGVLVRHIRGDGRVQSEADLTANEQPRLPLFEEPVEVAWRSARPVLRKDEEPAEPED